MRLLLVEDEEKIAKLLMTGLKSEGFSIDHISDGETGSYTARTNEYDLIILDNQLPCKPGLQVCTDIRTAGKAVPILVLSIVAEPSIKADFLNAGADDYLSKPFSFEELLARIHALLRRPQPLVEEILSIGDISLDSRRHVVKRGKEIVPLTNKEFVLLEYLLQHQGLTVSRGMILEHVWDMNTNPFSNTIETHVHSLRKKLSKRGKKNIIQTIPGRGYKIEL